MPDAVLAVANRPLGLIAECDQRVSMGCLLPCSAACTQPRYPVQQGGQDHTVQTKTRIASSFQKTCQQGRFLAAVPCNAGRAAVQEKTGACEAMRNKSGADVSNRGG